MKKSNQGQVQLDSRNELIATEAFDLMVTCLNIRSQSLHTFFNLTSLPDFVIETILGSPSQKVRSTACEQLKRLTRIKPVLKASSRRALDLDLELESSNSKKTTVTEDTAAARFLLTKLILKAPVPLWTSTCKRINHLLLRHCTEYFELRCFLLHSLSSQEQTKLSLCAKTMLEDELTFLNTYVPCSRQEDCTLLAGHLKVVEALIAADGVNIGEVGANIIPVLLDTHLFPASKIIREGYSNNVRDINPRCDTSESRVAAYNFMAKLCKNHGGNLSLIVDFLIQMHHSFDDSLSTDFEFEPLVDRRATCNFVGLKNAGATCYMNSCLQQLYCVPGLCEAVLGTNEESDSNKDDTIFYQLQNVFGHLSTSKLQYYIPEKFWQTFRLFGQPVNVREQQDAFEFFTQIIDQVDEWLADRKRAKIFPSFFEGTFSDQKICQECPHKYEREQTFMALNLTVKSANLTESLDQFVRGELLEGDNAYYCEKCNAKRSAVKRMSIRKLPKTLVIQLKRFHYDHETNRAVKFDDYFEFPRNLDMSPYTTEGIRQAEKSDKGNVNPIGEKRARTLSTSSLSTNGSKKSGSSFKQLSKQNYDLVGIVVHSGQASAGHYYSFIKDRHTERWLKFNDTTVEEFQMTDDSIVQECFGGSFKVKKSHTGSSGLPENRQRYWNAYMLFYEKRGNATPEARGSGSVRSLTLSTTGPIGKSTASTRKTSMPVGQPQQAAQQQPRESLSQLSDLLEKGEKRGIFAHSPSMPTSIEQNIHDENQRFILNRDVFCQDYYSFVCDLLATNASSRAAIAKDEGIALQSVKLAVYFMLNSYAHTKKRQKHLLTEMMDMIEAYLQKSSKTCQWMIEFFGSQAEGLCYMRPFLLECGAKEVRTMFSQLLMKALRFQKLHFCTTKVEPVENILASIYNLVKDDVAKHIKNSSQLFAVLSKFAQEGLPQCQQLLETDFFAAIVKLLIGLEIGSEESPEKINNRQRKWAPSQNRELGELHVTLATLILACDTTSCQDRAVAIAIDTDIKLLPITQSISTLLYGPLAPLYIREAVSACREANTTCVSTIIQGLVHASIGSTTFTDLLMKELLKQYNRYLLT